MSLLNIAKGAVKIPEEKIQEIVFTMAKDKTKREACRQAAAEEIMKLLDEGKSIAMLALGDIGIYSTYAYVHKRLLKEGYDVEMVSGIHLSVWSKQGWYFCRRREMKVLV